MVEALRSRQKTLDPGLEPEGKTPVASGSRTKVQKHGDTSTGITSTRRSRTKVTGSDETAAARDAGANASQLAPLHFDPAALPTDPVRAAEHAARIGRWNTKGAVLVTAKSVEELLASGDLSSLTPAIPRHLWPTVQALMECYSVDGPLGSHGPLSARGPIGRSPWNPSFWIGAEEHPRAEAAAGEYGPLGDHGADSRTAKEVLLPRINQLSAQLGAGGIFAAVGPEGALGPKGPLGFLGAVGGHGFAENDKGEFVGDGQVQRTTDVRAEGRAAKRELVELYTEKGAKSLRDNDTSWMVRGTDGGQGDTFAFTSKQDQFVTLTVVPENISDVFTLELLDEKGNVVAKSDSEKYVNWIQIQVDEGRKLKARVTLKKSEPERAMQHPIATYIDMVLSPLIAWGQAATPFLRAAGYEVDDAFARGAYRLCAVGSTDTSAETAVAGDHQARFCWLPEKSE